MPIRLSLVSFTVSAVSLLWGSLCTAVALSVDVARTNGAPLADAVIHIYSATSKTPLKPSPTAIVDQIDKEFVPRISVIQTGTSVRFPNKDNIRHQVYSFSPAKRFELRLYSGEHANAVVFDKPGLVALGCNIHDMMVGYIFVVDTPWFAISDGAGHAKVTELPPGEYTVDVWHYKLPDQVRAFHQTIKLTGDLAIKAVVDAGPAQ